MGYLGSRRAAGFISNEDRNPYGNGLWCVRFTPEIFALNSQIFQVYHIYLEGPAGSSFRTYAGMIPYSTASRGDANEWDPNQPLTMYGGQELSFYWNASAAPAPLVVVSMQTAPQ